MTLPQVHRIQLEAGLAAAVLGSLDVRAPWLAAVGWVTLHHCPLF